MPAVTRIAVVGAGGVGGYLGARLAAAGADVHLVARGRHLDAMRRDGLRLQSPLGDVHVPVDATDDVTTIGPVDAVLFCVKGTDTDAAAGRLGPLLQADTAVVSLQNGVDNEERIAAAIGPGHVLGGLTFIFSTIGESGTIVHTGGPARIVFGELDGRPTERARSLHQVCVDAGIDAVLTDDVRGAMWHKFALICAVAGTTTTTRLPTSAILADPHARALFRALVDETAAVGRAEGVALPDDLADELTAMTEGFGDQYSSLHYDLTHGKPMELDTLHGAVLRLAERHDVQVPMTRAVHAILSPWATRNAAP